jgi:hypothetical protein
MIGQKIGEQFIDGRRGVTGVSRETGSVISGNF